MAFITEVTQIGKILEHDIYQISHWKIESLFVCKTETSEKELKMMRSYLEAESNKFYYSYTYDLSHNLQDNFCFSLEPNANIKNKYETTQFPVFRWNDFLSINFRNASQNTIKRDKWVINMIHGYYEEMIIEMYSNILSVHIISRRMVQNAGTRYNRRGLNPEGFVANFVETEQIVANLTVSSKIKPLITSYIQVRGSVPLFWYQEADFLTPKPEIKIREVDIRMVGANKHFSDMIGLYGKNIFCLNLMKSRPHKKSNKEEILSDRYKELMEKICNLDKNFECLKYCHIDLKNSIKEDQDNFFTIAFKLAEQLTKSQRCFLINGFDPECQPGEVLVQFQNGISRINCVDCLDRTNFMLNIIGEIAFNNQLKTCLQMTECQRLEINQKILQKYQLIWKNTGDTIALQYGGSKAHDQKDSNVATVVYQSAKRHLANTFSDHNKQFEISLFLGDYVPGENKIWDIKVGITYSPSPEIISKMQEGELFGVQIKDFSKKQKLKNGRKLREGVYICTADSLSKLKVSQPFKELLLKPKLFENRKNLVSELIEKKVIKGYDWANQKDCLEEVEDANKKDYNQLIEEDRKKEETSLANLNSVLTDLRGFQNNLLFSQFINMTESWKSVPLNYKDIKANFYKQAQEPSESSKDFLFDLTCNDMQKEKLINHYNIYNLADDKDDAENLDERSCDEPLASRLNSIVGTRKQSRKSLERFDREETHSEYKRRESLMMNTTPSAALTSEVRQIIQNIPNTVKNKVKTF